MIGSEDGLQNESRQILGEHSGSSADGKLNPQKYAGASEEFRMHRMKIDRFLLVLGIVLTAASYTVLMLEMETAMRSSIGNAGLVGFHLGVLSGLSAACYFVLAMHYFCKSNEAASFNKTQNEIEKYREKEIKCSVWGRRCIVGSLLFVMPISFMLLFSARTAHTAQNIILEIRDAGK